MIPPAGVRATNPQTNIHPSANTHLAEHEAFIPKKCVHKYLGHSKGVQAIELFPYTGHLLLSGSMDGKCMIWDTMRDRQLLRTYMGHTEAVRSVNMSNDGSQFLSSSYDRYVRLWDVETGAAVATFSNRKMHYQGTTVVSNLHLMLLNRLCLMAVFCCNVTSQVPSNQQQPVPVCLVGQPAVRLGLSRGHRDARVQLPPGACQHGHLLRRGPQVREHLGR
jgi:hypothetical protein